MLPLIKLVDLIKHIKCIKLPLLAVLTIIMLTLRKPSFHLTLVIHYGLYKSLESYSESELVLFWVPKVIFQTGKLEVPIPCCC